MEWTNCNELQELSDVLNIIAQPNRMQLLCILGRKDEYCVCELLELTWLKQNLISHHLSILKNIWILKCRKEGKKVYYYINNENYDSLKLQMKQVFKIN